MLDPIKVLEKIETELGLTVIASNPAMLWYVLSKLGLAYPMSGYGRLLREWPKLQALRCFKHSPPTESPAFK